MRRNPEAALKFISIADLRYLELYFEDMKAHERASLAPDNDMRLVMMKAALKAGKKYLRKEHGIDYGKEQARKATD
jgi:hypothetical protein